MIERKAAIQNDISRHGNPAEFWECHLSAPRGAREIIPCVRAQQSLFSGVSQIIMLPRFLIVVAPALLLASCATQTTPHTVVSTSPTRRIAQVRTTAYTHSEGSSRNALGKRLRAARVRSAAADWSRFPLGTKFRIVGTDEIYEIDDYGSALIGTSTIDLYKSSRLAMRRWGVRRVDIDILEWGSSELSLKVLKPRARMRIARRMIVAIQDKARTQQALQSF